VRRLAIAFAAAAGLAGCSGGGSGMAPPAPSPPAIATSVDFTAFTTALVASQPETALPEPVTPSEFVFRDDDNPAAFAAVLMGP
jgi:hypothetical protein